VYMEKEESYLPLQPQNLTEGGKESDSSLGKGLDREKKKNWIWSN